MKLGWILCVPLVKMEWMQFIVSLPVRLSAVQHHSLLEQKKKCFGAARFNAFVSKKKKKEKRKEKPVRLLLRGRLLLYPKFEKFESQAPSCRMEGGSI